MAEWIQEVNLEDELKKIEDNAQYPLILAVGRHIDTNANSIIHIRTPLFELQCHADLINARGL
ncbi:MAG: hypothetical protein JRG97_09465 [Deltaproteobacteria bacterium]|nr:hypothetical protein [Deltaproteobacteria bacterium]MBW2141283.1 hypothetical protein [Deltaproteobacteria bacterium]